MDHLRVRGRLLLAAALTAVTGFAGWAVVDDHFAPHGVRCDLGVPSEAFEPPFDVGPSPLGRLAWHGRRLATRPFGISRGDQIRLRLRLSGPSEGVRLSIDDHQVALLEVGDDWRERHLIAPVDGQRLVLERTAGSDQPVHLSRLTWSGAVKQVRYPLVASLVSRSARRPAPSTVSIAWVSISAALALMLAGLAGRVDDRAARPCTWGSALALGPGTLILSALAATPPLVGLRAALPSATIAVVVLIVPTVATVWRWRRVVAAAPLAAFDPDHWSARSARLVGAGALLAFATVLLLLLPKSPFEWDEVLFANAVDRFDVAEQRPHAPGFPVYVGLAKLLRIVSPDAVVATQRATVCGSVAALLCTFLLTRKLGGSRSAASLGAIVLASVPAFLFNAVVGISDIVGAAAGAAALVAIVVFLDRGSLTPLLGAAGLCAVALGVRPQLGVLLAGPIAWAAVHALRRIRPPDLAAATCVGIGVSVACWLPAIAVTGVARYVGALHWSRQWIGRHETVARLPGAPVGAVMDAWLIRPFGTVWLAAAFWALIVAGVGGWLAGCQRRAVALGALSAAAYLALAPWTLHFASAPRYLLPVLPVAAVMIAGIAHIPARRVRRALMVFAVLTAALAIDWVAPAVLRRSRETAPVWATLEEVARRYDPETTVVQIADGVRAHAERVLGRSGFTLVAADAGVEPPAGSEQLVVRIDSPAAPAGPATVALVRWPAARLLRVARGRYASASLCIVTPRPSTPSRAESGPE